MYSFEDKIEEIDKLLKNSKDKWHLDALAWIDYDDVCQIIRNHIYVKWDMWDQERPFGPWCRTIIANQIKNELRNNYHSFAKPCLRCPHYVSQTECAFTKSKVQDSSCDEYAAWEKKKKAKHDVKIPVSIETSVIDSSTELKDEIDYEKSSKNLHEKVLEELTNEKHKEIYRLIYIEGVAEADVAQQMGFKKEAGKRKAPRYKQIDNVKSRFLSIAKKVLDSNDIIE